MGINKIDTEQLHKDPVLGYTKKFIDLHLHLDGAITVEIAKKLATIQNIELPVSDDVELENLLSVPEECTSLNDFLKCFAFPCSLLQTKEGIREAVYLVAEDMRKQGVIYAEIRFAPQLSTSNGLTQDEVVEAALEGLHRTELRANLILCCMRGEDTIANKEANLETVEVTKRFLCDHDGVTGLDLAGAEALYPNEGYMEIFHLAKLYGIPFTIHAGEASGAESIWSAIEMGASRIGHGVRAIGDPELLKYLQNNPITLEMCPTSNSQTKAVENMDDYPLIHYLEMGINVTLNTDDPAIERTDIAREYHLMEERYGLTPIQERALLMNAIDSAFTNEVMKEQLRILI